MRLRKASPTASTARASLASSPCLLPHHAATASTALVHPSPPSAPPNAMACVSRTPASLTVVLEDCADAALGEVEEDDGRVDEERVAASVGPVGLRTRQ